MLRPPEWFNIGKVGKSQVSLWKQDQMMQMVHFTVVNIQYFGLCNYSCLYLTLTHLSPRRAGGRSLNNIQSTFSEGDIIADKEVSLGELYQWRECDAVIPRLLTPQCPGCKYKCDSRYCVTLSRARDQKTLITPGNYDNHANTAIGG